jgi:hypothetical protein
MFYSFGILATTNSPRIQRGLTDPPGKKFVTPNQDVLVTRLYCKCCAEEYVESGVNIHHICINIQIITSESTSKDCMGHSGLKMPLIAYVVQRAHPIEK